MLDRQTTAVLRPFIKRLAQALARAGWQADTLTWCGFAIGLAGSLAIGLGHFWVGLALLLVSRLFDALDGAVARLDRPTDRGAFLDIALDFVFYASVPLAFAVADPTANALPAAVLLASFVGTGSSFLAFAVLAAKRGMASTAYPDKSFFFLGGLTEATETLLCFAAMCVWPEHFAALAYGFAALCALTTATRIAWGWRAFGPPGPDR